MRSSTVVLRYSWLNSSAILCLSGIVVYKNHIEQIDQKRYKTSEASIGDHLKGSICSKDSDVTSCSYRSLHVVLSFLGLCYLFTERFSSLRRDILRNT